tara:strand:+ start:1879 stop:2856 length:978 start_codon:yes stop_codon:yes gene_type:complete
MDGPHKINLFNKVCIYDKTKCQVLMYGQKLKSNRNTCTCKDYNINIVENGNSGPGAGQMDFIIKIDTKKEDIEGKELSFVFGTNRINCELFFPFESSLTHLDESSCIVCTMCELCDNKKRLDEWIQYNQKLGFSGIIIFSNDNEENIDEMKKICKKYEDYVSVVSFPYKALRKDIHWNNIQRASFNIGCEAFKNRCAQIALIDTDEFIYITSNPQVSIVDFMKGKGTCVIQSNIITNKGIDDVFNNNVLSLCKYVGPNKYQKIILSTGELRKQKNIFICTPHKGIAGGKLLKKTEIIHYHCWVNKRWEYNDNMPILNELEQFMNG